MSAVNRQIAIAADRDALARLAAQRLLIRIEKQPELIAICLTGGSGPTRLYDLLANEFADRIPWNRVHWFIGDERFVPAGDLLNNMGTARRALLDGRAPPDHIHSISTDCATPDEAARRYEADLKTFYGAEQLDPTRPLFDLVLMGVGPDGHTASLFPSSPALNETVRWAVGVDHANVAPFVPRVTLTLPTLGSTRDMLFLVGGSDKRDILARILAGEDLPAARAQAEGETVWLVDREAAPESRDGA
jgi:6-phosphogluconolactonase